ncbi:hypothetical protein ASE14_12120 [Agromyces sp. Root81]|uniref:hypothetical protein n=1 Tax=Agromyces sp. Root81 TaxID=1736601 RepID=UPI0006FEDB49|nr:hypothetical protein [Agromyces sp. Root81]KRC61582.1 hypothetical protein ASE14_12120 [Agromyces sp. Root81]
MTSLAKLEMYQSLRPAQRLAALSALKSALDEQIKVEKDRSLEVAAEVGVKSFSTEFGGVTVVEKDAPIAFNEFELFDFVKETAPEVIETVEQVPDWYVAQLTNTKNIQIIDGVVYDLKGGLFCVRRSLSRAGSTLRGGVSGLAQLGGRRGVDTRMRR